MKWWPKAPLKTSAASDDVKNLQKVLGKRIDAAVVDKNVLAHLLNTVPELASAKGKINLTAPCWKTNNSTSAFKKGLVGETRQGLERRHHQN